MSFASYEDLQNGHVLIDPDRENSDSPRDFGSLGNPDYDGLGYQRQSTANDPDGLIDPYRESIGSPRGFGTL